MSLARDLLAQAQMLATREPKKPRQASLRRAVSSAYYALFHQLVDAASRQLVSGSDNTRLRHRVSRSFRHNEMKNTCKDFAQWREWPFARDAGEKRFCRRMFRGPGSGL